MQWHIKNSNYSDKHISFCLAYTYRDNFIFYKKTDLINDDCSNLMCCQLFLRFKHVKHVH